ncbi:MAG: hypothetical protein RIR63_813 [Actinomycetota bacterium]
MTKKELAFFSADSEVSVSISQASSADLNGASW